jgi:hypothetical protein
MTATDFMTNIACAIEAVRYGDKQLQPQIKAGSLERLLEEIDRVVQMTRKETSPEDNWTGSNKLTFMGVPVRESKILPSNIVVILEGNEVMNIINLDKARET